MSNGFLTTVVAGVIAAVVLAIAAAFFFGGAWERRRRRHTGQPSGNQVGQPSGSASTEGTPFAYKLVLYSVLGAIAAFLVVMLAFASFGIFKEGDAANAAAALSALFGIIGTLVGAYFGIKTSSSAQDILHQQATTTTDAATSTTQAAFAAVSQGGSAATEGLLSATQGLHAAWNAGDEETILGFFTENATITVTTATDTPPQHFLGKEQIRTDFVRKYMHNFQVDSRNYRQDANRMVWESMISADKFRRTGINPVEGTAVATFEGGKIASLTFTFSPATQQRTQGAGNQTSTSP